MKFNKYMSCLAIEITRRCNMNCKFCGKGKSQNMDISKNIIDKTLDEMSGVYIESLRISGGEPFLAPELIEYLIEQIISKHIFINHVCIFTNGYHRNLELIPSFINLLEYLRSIERDIRLISRWADSTTQKIYEGTNHSKFDIIISDNGRDVDKHEIDKTLEFFKQINDEDISVVKQSDTFKSFGQITLEGNAKSNYRELIGDSVSLMDIRILDNNYCFIARSANLSSEPFLKDMTFVNKTLSISANGNVFPGCLMSYDRVDKESMFNVLDCHNDFLDRVISFCWEHPLNSKAVNIRSKFAAIEFCRAHNIDVKYMSKTDYDLTKAMNDIVKGNEIIARDMHSMLPTLDFNEIEAISIATTVLEMFETKTPLDFIKLYLNWCTDFDSDTINTITPEWCRGFILHISEMDKKRKNQN